jgi:hypothetical protein
VVTTIWVILRDGAGIVGIRHRGLALKHLTTSGNPVARTDRANGRGTG